MLSVWNNDWHTENILFHYYASFKDVLMWTIFKVFLNLSHCGLCFHVGFLAEACEVLAPQPETRPTPPALEGGVLTSRLPGKSLLCFNSYYPNKKLSWGVWLIPWHCGCQPLVFSLTVLSDSICVCAQSCLNLCDPMDCSPPGSSVPGDFQARTLEGVAIPDSRGSSQPRDWTCVSCVPAGGSLNTMPPGKPQTIYLSLIRWKKY